MYLGKIEKPKTDPMKKTCKYMLDILYWCGYLLV
jgi:hypothetical protein